MKPKNTGWAIQDPKENFYVWTIKTTRQATINSWSRSQGCNWANEYSRGYRCIKVKITPLTGGKR